MNRLSAALDHSRRETQQLWERAQQQQSMMAAENESLRAEVTRLTRLLAAARDAHGVDANTLRVELQAAAAEKETAVERLMGDVAFVQEEWARGSAALEAKLLGVKIDRETAVEKLRVELEAVRAEREQAVRAVEVLLEAARAEKIEAEAELRAAARKAYVEIAAYIVSRRGLPVTAGGHFLGTRRTRRRSPTSAGRSRASPRCSRRLSTPARSARGKCSTRAPSRPIGSRRAPSRGGLTASEEGRLPTRRERRSSEVGRG